MEQLRDFGGVLASWGQGREQIEAFMVSMQKSNGLDEGVLETLLSSTAVANA